MFERISKSFGELIFSRHDTSTDAYFASSTDLADLERRMRHVENDAPRYTLPFCGSMNGRDDAHRF